MKTTKPDFKKIKLLAMDFDGVMTDGHVWTTGHEGVEMVMSSRIDSMGLELLRRLTDVKACVISKETNPVVQFRCDKLKLPCYQCIDKGEGKLDVLKRVMVEQNLKPEEVIFMGDDVTDITPMEFVSLPIAPANGRDQVKAVAVYVTKNSGGNGAIREVCELLLESRGQEIKL